MNAFSPVSCCISFYCTFAVTDAAPFRTNVQLWVSLLPLEQAPDQIALLPVTTESVMPVPTLNDACCELPTVTLIPAGFEAICCPLRPVAVTVSVAVATGGATGLIVRIPHLVISPGA